MIVIISDSKVNGHKKDGGYLYFRKLWIVIIEYILSNRIQLQ